MSERDAESEPTFSCFLMDFDLYFEVQNGKKIDRKEVSKRHLKKGTKKASKMVFFQTPMNVAQVF